MRTRQASSVPCTTGELSTVHHSIGELSTVHHRRAQYRAPWHRRAQYRALLASSVPFTTYYRAASRASTRVALPGPVLAGGSQGGSPRAASLPLLLAASVAAKRSEEREER
eukprot:3181132-Rhodomonas_salina.1